MKKGNTYTKVIVAVLVVIIIALAILFTFMVLRTKQTQEVSNQAENNVIVAEIAPEPEPEPIKIYSGEDRPIAVMIDNVGGARPQAGLNDAYVVYEIIVEGGYTRMMAIFKGQDLDQIGPVRSARHYFLDYALENDALYAHFGWSPQAQSDINLLDVDNINGLIASSTQFWRVKDKAAPHNVVTSTEKMLEIAENNGYRTTSKEKSVLNYVPKEVDLSKRVDSVPATDVILPFSKVSQVELQYNAETGTYEKYADGKLQEDWLTKDVVSCKNIIITFAENYPINDGENKDRQELENVGVLEGYYITNGNAIKITCDKPAREEKTVYKDLNGKEIEVNDGNTFIEIVPIDCDVTIE